jgi:AraC-like DNA-binding protein
LIGFAELSIFSRTFKNRFGESPTQWRINHSGRDKAGLRDR